MTKATQTTSTLHTRQKEIIYTLYRFRFLNRIHIQHLLHHKQFNRIIAWLNDLTTSGYIKRYYNPKIVTQPAFYSLGSKGRTFLRDSHEYPDVKHSVLDRVWQEYKTSGQFKSRCMVVTDLYLSLLSLVQKTHATMVFKTQTDLYGMHYLIIPPPDAFFAIKEHSGSTRGYFLDVFDEHPARKKLYDRIERYFSYYEANYWQDHSADPFPNIIFVCPDAWSVRYLHRKIQYRLDSADDLNFYLTTRDLLKLKGMCREVLQKVELPD
jgi:hypothetical protein